MPQLDGKKTGKRTIERHSMSMDGSGSKKVKAKSFDEDTFFTLWFHSINLCLPGAGVCKDDQSIANKKEAENTSTGRVDKPATGGVDKEEDPSTSGADAEENPGTNGANKLGTDRGDGKKDLDGADIKEEPGISRVDKPSTGKRDKPGIGVADKPGKGGADEPGTGGVEKLGTSKADKPNTAGADKPSTSRADKLGTIKVDKIEGQLVRRQVAAQMSLFSFCKVRFFFSSLELKTCSLLSCSFSSSFLSLINSIKQDNLSFKYSSVEIYRFSFNKLSLAMRLLLIVSKFLAKYSW